MVTNWLKSWRYRAPCLAWRLAAFAGVASSSPAPVAFVIEEADWAIRRVGESIRDVIEAEAAGRIVTTTHPERLIGRVVHFGSQYMWLSWGPHMAASNRFVVSFFHGKPEDGPEVAAHIDCMLESMPRLAKIIASTSIVECRLRQWGVPAEKIVRIPIGVDTRLFTPPTAEQRAEARRRFGFPDDAVVVGSFQKDGVGWDDGMEPKLIKGPDIFLQVIERMKREASVFVLLTGPARGFVMQGLDRMGVPYVHTYAKEYKDLVACYHALDLYLVTSREEGGPMGLLESMASGVPVVSTTVGMAPDLIEDGHTGGLVDTENAEVIADKAWDILYSGNLNDLKLRARDAVGIADWSVVGRDHWLKVYQPALEEG